MKKTKNKSGVNTYTETVYIGTVNGKKKYTTVTAHSTEELNKIKTQLKGERTKAKKNGAILYTAANFAEMADEWLSVKKSGNVGISTYKEYKAAINHLKNRFSNYKISEISYAEFQTFINELAQENPNTGKPSSKKVLKDIRSVAANIFKYCQLNDVLYTPTFLNDVENITIPKAATETKRRALTENEIQMIIDTPNRAQLPAMLLLFSGIRRGERLALTWGDINLNKSWLKINKSVEFDENKTTVKAGGKTENATRFVPFAQILCQYLQKEKQQQFTRYKEKNPKYSEFEALANFEKELICKTAKGQIFTKSAWRKLWESYMLDLNLLYGYENLNKFNPTVKEKKLLPMKIEPFTAHYLRHTYATMLYYQNVNVVTAKEILGHADIQTTVNIYTDLKKVSISDSYKNKLQNEYKINIA